MSRFCFCNCPAGFSAEPERHAPDCPGRSGAGKARTPVPATTPAPTANATEELAAVLHWRSKHAVAIKERDALQALLTAADDRADALTTALNRIIWRCDVFIEDGAGMSVESVEAIRYIAQAALKPAEAARRTNCNRATIEQCDDAGCGCLGAPTPAPTIDLKADRSSA